MGVVYLGRSEAGALAAVKVIRAESATDDEFRARFAREAQLAARVESPGWSPCSVPTPRRTSRGSPPRLCPAPRSARR